MFPLKSLLAGLALSLTAASLTVPAALAQGTKVIVIDSAKIIRDSKAGLDIRAKLKTLGESMSAELKPEADQLASELKTLEANIKAVAPEARANDAGLKAQVQTYAAKEAPFNRKRQIMAQELNLTRQKAWTDFRLALNPVLQQVVTEQSADLMIDRANAVYAGAAIDVTDSIIAKLDAATPTITVQRQKIPVQTQQ